MSIEGTFERRTRLATFAATLQKAWSYLVAAASLTLACTGAVGQNGPAAAGHSLAPTAPASAAGQKTDAGKVVFKLAVDFLPAGSVQLSNGVEVNVGDWPALAMASIPVGSGLASCTATFVGPTVLLTAAHCVDAALLPEPRKLFVKVDGNELELRCTISPAYLKHPPRAISPRGSEDYALCIWRGNGKDPLPTSLKALTTEVVEVSKSVLKGDKVLMVGYGCINLRVVDDEFRWDPSDQTLRIGDEQIDRAPKYDAAQPAYAMLRSVNGKEPALCPGDSGGPMFSGATTTDPRAKRRIRAVNSAINKEKVGDGYDILSFVSSTATVTFEEWATKWLEDEAKLKPSVKPIICGVNKKAGEYPCRQ